MKKGKETGKAHLADVLLWFLPYLKMYISFIGQYESATKLIKQYYTSNAQFKAILTAAVNDSRSQDKFGKMSKPLGLTDLMPKPLQRIFAYNNMLQRMAEILPNEARVYPHVIKVKTEMEKYILWINETKRSIEQSSIPSREGNNSPGLDKKKTNFFSVVKLLGSTQ